MKRYFSGIPYKHDHTAERLVSNRGCVDCNLIALHKWRAANPEKDRAATDRWQENNVERVRESRRKYYLKNADKQREYSRLYRRKTTRDTSDQIANGMPSTKKESFAQRRLGEKTIRKRLQPPRDGGPMKIGTVYDCMSHGSELRSQKLRGHFPLLISNG